MSSPNSKPSKKLIVLCDGTWQNSDVGWEKNHIWEAGHPQIPTNITRIARAIPPEDANLRPQIVYYQSGVGSQPYSITDHLMGGGLAIGLSENVREAYGFLAHNFQVSDNGQPDEIYLLGFSRGAFTARSVGGLIASLGLLTKEAMEYFYYIFEDFENAGRGDYKVKLPKAYPEFKVTENAKRFSDIYDYLQKYKAELVRHNLTRDVQIDAIGVWDTVGTLGLPITPLLQNFGFPTTIHKYRFFDTTLSNHIKNAFHALALDERRSAFQATVWEKKPGNNTNLKQVWFPGVHSNCGGGYPNSSVADLTLAWMCDQLGDFIDFNEDYLVKQVTEAIRAKNTKKPQNTSKHIWRWGLGKIRDSLTYLVEQVTEAILAKETKTTPNKHIWRWGLGKIYDSLTFPMNLIGSTVRTPGRYKELDYDSGKPTNPQKMLTGTNEFIHASVRARYSYGHDAWKNKYKSPALDRWSMIRKTMDDGSLSVTWQYNGRRGDLANGRVIPEAKLGKFEKLLLLRDPKMKEDLFPDS